jgi:LAO/AO transport system kinase
MLHLGGPPRGGWEPPIVPAVALRDEGVAAVAAAIERHIAALRASGRFAEQQRIRAAHEFRLIVQEAALERARARIADEGWDALVARIARREIDPYTAAEDLLV